jgi:dsDNA-binding SOS-regulon protein
MNYEQMFKELQKNFQDFIEKQRADAYAKLASLGSSLQEEEEKAAIRLFIGELKNFELQVDRNIESIIATNADIYNVHNFK